MIDEYLSLLKGPLEQKGFNVLIPKAGKQAPEIMTEDLPGRVFVTNNPTAFVGLTLLLDYSIIDTTMIGKSPQFLADMIATAWLDHSLKVKHPGFYLKLRLDGWHEVSIGP